jgi:hypothetical protein
MVSDAQIDLGATERLRGSTIVTRLPELRALLGGAAIYCTDRCISPLLL